MSRYLSPLRHPGGEASVAPALLDGVGTHRRRTAHHPSLSEGVMYEDQGNFPDEIEGSDLLTQAQSTATALRTLRKKLNERIKL